MTTAKSLTDPFDPNTWALSPEGRIYLDDNAQTWAIVDAEDYAHFSRWRWHVNKPHATRNGKKEYVVRSTWAKGRRIKLYLHVEIMKRTGVEPPSPLHKLVDHKDGNELNCRRSNLRWATPRQNRANINGQMQTDLL